MNINELYMFLKLACVFVINDPQAMLANTYIITLHMAILT